MEPAPGATEADAVGPILDVSGVTVRFGGVTALDDVSLSVADDTVCALIGPNGAGKTTLFNCVSGLYRAETGAIRFAGRDLTRVAVHEIAGLGLARTFQNVALLPTLSVLGNVMLGAYARGHLGFVGAAFARRRSARREQDVLERAHHTLGLLGLADQADKRPDELPFGSLKRVEIARALLSRPQLVLLDEPACGLNHAEVEELGRLIVLIRERLECAVLVVEHNMSLVRAIADTAYVLDAGRVIAEGTVDEVSADPQVVEAYLGAVA